MNTFGNILWIIFGGLLSCICWGVCGTLWCITIVGIPLGKQCFKFAKLSLAPFGKDIVDVGSTSSLIANILWIVFTGFPMAIENTVTGVILCVTIVGIPFGKQFFKLAWLALAPFGKEIV